MSLSQPPPAPLAVQAAGSGCGHGARLLEALVIYILPRVSPCGEALGNIGLDADGRKPASPAPVTARSTVELNRSADRDDDKEGRKEDERRAEVPDKGEGDDAECREADEGIEVITAIEPVEC